MTNLLYLDTDCVSAFLWVGYEMLLVNLYKGRIIIPTQVYDELRRVPPLKNKTDTLIAKNELKVQSIVFGTPEADLYIRLTINPDPGFRKIGDGEAAAITLAKFNTGILGSNNLKDVRSYVLLYQIQHTTTGDILIDAFAEGLISESEGNKIWVDMIRRQRKLPTATFSDFINSK